MFVEWWVNFDMFKKSLPFFSCFIVCYSDDPPLPILADRSGVILELIHPSMNNEFLENWSSSCGSGTLGFIDSKYSVNADLLRNFFLRLIKCFL